MGARIMTWSLLVVAGMWSISSVAVAAPKTQRSSSSQSSADSAEAPKSAHANPKLVQQTSNAEGLVNSVSSTSVQITRKDGATWTFVIDPKNTKMDAVAVGDAIQVQFTALMSNNQPEGPAYANQITRISKAQAPAVAAPPAPAAVPATAVAPVAPVPEEALLIAAPAAVAPAAKPAASRTTAPMGDVVKPVETTLSTSTPKPSPAAATPVVPASNSSYGTYQGSQTGGEGND